MRETPSHVYRTFTHRVKEHRSVRMKVLVQKYAASTVTDIKIRQILINAGAGFFRSSAVEVGA